MSKYNQFIGSKVTKVDGNNVYFDNGKLISFHEYETYIEDYTVMNCEEEYFVIEESYLTDFEYIVIATSYKSPLHQIPLIEKCLRKIGYEGRVLFDLTLCNGYAANRFIDAYFDSEKFLKHTFKDAEVSNESLLNEIYNFHKDNPKYVKNSSLPDAQKDVLLKGLLIKRD